MKTVFLQEKNYKEAMESKVEPYLKKREKILWLERDPGCKIFCARYTTKNPKGVVVISHGFTETAEKYKEVIYYFLRARYHVYIPEHCGHGRSYRLTEDLSLVHVDSWERYVKDLTSVAWTAQAENEGLPLYLYGHSMGGGIAAATVARSPYLFAKVILSSPMIRPSTGMVPWHDAKAIADLYCAVGREEQYVAGQKPYHGRERFETSSSLSRARFEYYQDKKEKEPLFQTNAASYGWLHEASELNQFLQKEAWKEIEIPVLIFQAGRDTLVVNKEQVRFGRKILHAGKNVFWFVRVRHAKHEIFGATDRIIQGYWSRVLRFLNM